MLVNFRFKNCRSFFEESNLSMEAEKDNTLQEINTFEVNAKLMPKGENELLKSAVIFGSNASGKTNVLKALTYMRNAIQLSASQFPVIQKNEYFAFMQGAENIESVFEVEIIEDNTFYKYGFSILYGEISGEWLERRKERLTTVFKRSNNQLEISGLPSQATKLINVGKNTLFLSVGNNFNLDIGQDITNVMNWFTKLIIVFENNRNSLDMYSFNQDKYRKQAIKILKQADIGIDDFSVKKDKIADITDFNDVLRFNVQLQTNPNGVGQIKQESSNLYDIDLQTTFNVYDENHSVVGHKDVMLLKEEGFNSEGTLRLLCYLGFILAALDYGRVILIDEIDAKLHFLVADYIVKLFNSIDKNPHNAQLICTAHNVMLMDEDLRRDQIYFTSKDKYGQSILTALSDYKNVRKQDLFSKKYLAGFYSKLPDMSIGE